MQPSEYEIQREVETLRDIRRRSSAQGGILDPDLPAVSSDSGSSTGYWEDSSSSSHGDDSDGGSVGGDDPFSPFWVPARLHPEIAPAEFRQFLKEHSRAPGDGAALERTSSVGSTGLGRKKSMLSRQYNPSEKDGVEEEKVVPLRRNRTSVFANQGPQLTISDLQKLEQLAEEASQSSDPSKLRSVLRRSISLNIAPSVIDQMDDMPDLGDDADSPIIVPRPGQILRRAARTKIRKSGTSEGPHRFTSSRARRGSATRAATVGPQTSRDRTSSDVSSSDHGDEPPRRRRADSDVPELPINTRPESYSEESSIYDAYAREDDEPEPHAPLLVTSPESPEFSLPVVNPSLPQTAVAPYEPSPELHHPQPQRLLSPPLPDSAAPPRTPSPETAPSPVAESPSTSPRPPLPHQQASYQAAPPPSSSPSPSEHRKEKDKKGGLFGKWGSDKSSKKGHQHQGSKEKEKEKEGGFFGSLFGGKKKQEDTAPPMGGLGGAGREAAVALLGTSKSAKAYAPSPSPQPVQGYARYPIHVERAIYRLSHIKLANPRRPLYEQVLISNLMFWYLGVINKGPSPANPSNGTQQTPANGMTDKEQEQAEKEKKEREEREKAERERAEKEREKELAKEKERNAESKRKGSLTKSPAPGAPRRAEMAVRGPQYDMQHRAMEQEYGYGGGNPPMGRTASAPPGPAGYSRTGGAAPAPYQSVQLVQPQPQVPQNRYYTPQGISPVPGQPYSMNQPSSQLPPGAMPPVNVEQTWVNSATGPPMSTGNVSPPSTSPPPRATSPPSAMHTPGNPRRAKSPPGGQRYSPAAEKQPYSGTGRSPGRSLSASATPPIPQGRPPANGAVLRKGNSAHAVMAHREPSEEEDIPLAMYQQRRK